MTRPAYRNAATGAGQRSRVVAEGRAPANWITLMSLTPFMRTIRKNNVKTLTKLIIAVAAIVAAFGVSSADAQRNYDPKTVETIEGKVLSVEKTPSKGQGYGVHLTLQTEKETISVHLGPGWYIDKQTPKIETNDTITVNRNWFSCNRWWKTGDY